MTEIKTGFQKITEGLVSEGIFWSICQNDGGSLHVCANSLDESSSAKYAPVEFPSNIQIFNISLKACPPGGVIVCGAVFASIDPDSPVDEIKITILDNAPRAMVTDFALGKAVRPISPTSFEVFTPGSDLPPTEFSVAPEYRIVGSPLIHRRSGAIYCACSLHGHPILCKFDAPGVAPRVFKGNHSGQFPPASDSIVLSPFWLRENAIVYFVQGIWTMVEINTNKTTTGALPRWTEWVAPGLGRYIFAANMGSFLDRIDAFGIHTKTIQKGRVYGFDEVSGKILRFECNGYASLEAVPSIDEGDIVHSEDGLVLRSNGALVDRDTAEVRMRLTGRAAIRKKNNRIMIGKQTFELKPGQNRRRWLLAIRLVQSGLRKRTRKNEQCFRRLRGRFRAIDNSVFVQTHSILALRDKQAEVGAVAPANILYPEIFRIVQSYVDK